MTLSDKARVDAVQTALRTMQRELGDRAFVGVRFEVHSPPFADLPPTTWLELESEMYVRPAHDSGGPAYKLTGPGWIAALRAAGLFEAPNQRESAVKLKTVLQSIVKGRSIQGASTELWSLQSQTGLPLWWIENALDSRLLQYLWPDRHLDLDLQRGLRDIRVPGRFGSNRISGVSAGPLVEP